MGSGASTDSNPPIPLAMETMTATCPFCAKEVPANVKRCPHCLRDAPDSDGAYELPTEAADVPAEWRRGAIYTLEFPARCPHCREYVPIRESCRACGTTMSAP